ncbi:ABC transporter ATP-binding protein [Paenibacillus sp. SI8]|uniref:ABC transporter ATP-binding protein n=1 Tax=unclassified Paenibacillus TaxID=185978 RepID=UPI00346536D4
MKFHKNLSVFIKTQLHLLEMVYRELPTSVILFCVLSIGSSIFSPALILINKNIIDSISGIDNDPHLFKISIMLLILHFTVQYLSTILSNIVDYVYLKISNKFNYVVKKKFIERVVTVELELFNDGNFYNMLNLSNQAMIRNVLGIFNSIVVILTSLVSLVGIYGILYSIHWSLPLALFVSTVPGMFLVFRSKSRGYKTNKDNLQNNREIQFTENLFMNLQTIKEIRIFQIKDYLIQKWSTLFLKIQDQNIKLAFWELKSKSLAVLILQVTNLGVSFLLVNQIFDNNLSIGSYVAMIGAATSVQGIFASIGGNLGTIFENAIYNNTLVKLLNYKTNDIVVETSSNVKIIEEISLENVSFKYPYSDATALDNINLTIKRGEKISIVGFNGSGKTTLVNCILGLYKPTSGEININGMSIDQCNKADYYKLISCVFQDFTKYKYSIRENVGVGDINKIENDNNLYNILGKVNMLEKVNGFKDQLETYLTKEVIDGMELSGGEWQRIAIARGFFRDSDLTILDEPTAALDPITELNIFELFKELSENKTTITISHRLGPTKYSDRIIVMEKGKIVEDGNFDLLMNNKGLFYSMYVSQSKWYEIKEEKLNDAS